MAPCVRCLFVDLMSSLLLDPVSSVLHLLHTADFRFMSDDAEDIACFQNACHQTSKSREPNLHNFFIVLLCIYVHKAEDVFIE